MKKPNNTHDHKPAKTVTTTSTPTGKTPAPPRRRSRVVAVSNSRSTIPLGDFPQLRPVSGNDFHRWGDDNMLPTQLAEMSRRSTTHRRIINDKADYISGRGFTTNGESDTLLGLIESANANGETMRQVLNRLAFDKALFGNAFMEIVTDAGGSILSLFHRDASQCRVMRDQPIVIMHHDWARYLPDESERVPLFPEFVLGPDGFRHSMVHYKDYEPMFCHYGVPSYIAGVNVSNIAWKTDRWNIARLDNSFQLSGVMMLDAADDEVSAMQIVNAAERKFAGQPGQVMFMVKEGMKEDTSRFIPITSGNDGDWKTLHDQATGDIVVAHSWFRSLSGLDYGGGFSAERIMHEYEIALSTVIEPEQADLLEPIRRVIRLVLGIDASSLAVVNRPPTRKKSPYMKVWEARRDAGLEYDPSDPLQQLFIAQITKYALQDIE
ncbi:MAG: phage portal protein [Alistipes sp.]|jgi:hypothetical protein|nr:phage portal protein [Alistipes sp.]